MEHLLQRSWLIVIAATHFSLMRSFFSAIVDQHSSVVGFRESEKTVSERYIFFETFSYFL
jgi:hypothetical protein